MAVFGMGPGYAELLRPEDAQKAREDKATAAAAKHAVDLSLEFSTDSDESTSSESSDTETGCSGVGVGGWSHPALLHHHRRREHVPVTRVNTLDTEADALAHGIDRQLFLEWTRVFERLDHADGNADGLIDRKAFLKWLRALDLQKTIEFEANLNISPRKLEKLISMADRNKDGFVDRSEFIRLVSNRDKQLSRKQQSLLHQYLRVAAYAEEYTWCPPPWFIIGITLLQTSVYIYHIAHFLRHPDHEGEKVTWTGPEPTCSKLIFDPGRRHEAWRYVSYCLVHAELSHGSFRVALVYFFGVVSGSLGTSAVDPNVFLAGASGGVYALIAAHLATLILNWHEDIVIMKRRFRSGKSTSAKHGHIVRFIRLVTVMTYGVIDTGVAMYNRHVGGDVKVSYVAHLMGAISGLLIGIIVLKNRRVEHWETKLKVVCVFVFLLLVASMIVWNICGNELNFILGGGNSTYFRSELYEPATELDQGIQPKCHSYI